MKREVGDETNWEPNRGAEKRRVKGAEQKICTNEIKWNGCEQTIWQNRKISPKQKRRQKPIASAAPTRITTVAKFRERKYKEDNLLVRYVCAVMGRGGCDRKWKGRERNREQTKNQTENDSTKITLMLLCRRPWEMLHNHTNHPASSFGSH